MQTTNYVLGFMFNPSMQGVILMRKTKPKWQAGLLNGVGGHIEEGEAPLDAMVREFKEETGSSTEPTRWRYFNTMRGMGWICHTFAYHANEGEFQLCTTQADEVIVKVSPLNLFAYRTISNIPWLVWMAMDVLRNHDNGNNRLVVDVLYDAYQRVLPDGVYRPELEAAIKEPFAPVPDDMSGRHHTPDPQTIALNMMEVLNPPTEMLEVKTEFAGEQVQGMIGRIDFTQNGVADLLRWMEAHPDEQPALMMDPDGNLHVVSLAGAMESEEPYRPVCFNMLNIGWPVDESPLSSFNDMLPWDIDKMYDYINQGAEIKLDDSEAVGPTGIVSGEIIMGSHHYEPGFDGAGKMVEVSLVPGRAEEVTLPGRQTRPLVGSLVLEPKVASYILNRMMKERGWQPVITMSMDLTQVLVVEQKEAIANGYQWRYITMGMLGIESPDKDRELVNHDLEEAVLSILATHIACNMIASEGDYGNYMHQSCDGPDFTPDGKPVNGPSFDDSEKQVRGGQIQNLVTEDLQPESSAGSEPFPGNIPGQTVEGSETGSTPVSLDDSAGLPADSDAITERTSTGKRKTRRSK